MFGSHVTVEVEAGKKELPSDGARPELSSDGARPFLDAVHHKSAAVEETLQARGCSQRPHISV